LLELRGYTSTKGRHTGNVYGQDGIENVRLDGVAQGRGDGGEVDEGALAGDADGVEDEEGVVAQPGLGGGLPAGQREGEEGVANDLGDGPGDEHGRVEGRCGEEGEGVDDGPDEEEARRDLREGGEDGSTDDAWDSRKTQRLAWGGTGTETGSGRTGSQETHRAASARSRGRRPSASTWSIRRRRRR